MAEAKVEQCERVNVTDEPPINGVCYLICHRCQELWHPDPSMWGPDFRPRRCLDRAPNALAVN